MLQIHITEDVITLITALSLLGSFVCFVTILIKANLNAWSNITKDKAMAEKDKKKGERKHRIPERELLRDAWFGGTCGIVALVWKWHKVRKPWFLLRYCFHCSIGVMITMTALFLYLVLGLSHIVFYWTPSKDVLLHFAEWSEEMRQVLKF